MLSATRRLAAIFSIGFVAWALMLYPYGDGYAKAHVALYMAITLMAVIFGLMHLRGAALIAMTCVLVPMVTFFWGTGEPVFQAIAVNVAMAAVTMMMILLRHYDEFAALVESRAAIAERAEEARLLNAENTRLANLDALTDLPNRRNFLARLEAEFAAARASGRSLAVGLIDLDGFKPINDAFGHSIGDRLLVEVGNRLRSFSDCPMFVARLGGDEFGIIIARPVSNAELLAAGNRICSLLREPFELPGVTAQIGASIGFCTFPAEAESAQDLFERADYALYYAKRILKGAAVIFNDRHAAEIRESGRIENALRRADLEREMTVSFQPVVDITSGRTVSFEALARWTSPELGEVPPGSFIRAAERSEQITRVTRHLLGKALSAVRSWPMDMRIAINLSARDIASAESINQIMAIVRGSLVAPHRIDFEVTETAIVQDFEQARASLLALRAIGARIALDDFGTGHSSLSHVRLLPIDALKVDASFVADIVDHQPSEDIVRAVLELCRNLRLDCVVEGVERADQLDKIRQIGARNVQGYHLARPMREADIAAYLNGEALRALKRSSALHEQQLRRA